MPHSSSFTVLDWLVLAAYLVVVAVIGVLAARRALGAPDATDAFTGGRRMPPLAVGISFLATSLSAATFIGGPQLAYGGDLTYLSAQLGSFAAMAIVALLFLPAFYREGVVSVYELLGAEWGHVPQRIASAMFMAGRVAASGARLFMVGIPFALIVFGDLSPGALLTSILGVGAIATVYTAFGGIRAVIWTDVLQGVVIVATIGWTIIALLQRIPASDGEIVAALDAAEKLRVIDTGINPHHAFTLWTALTGFLLFNLAAYGTDQDLTQRLLTCRTARDGQRSVFIAMALSLPVTAVFLLVGVLLYAYYQVPDLLHGAAAPDAPEDSRKVLLHFVLTELPAGVRGAMVAGLFAAAMSSLDSALNAMASAAMTDFRSHRPRSGSAPRHASRLMVAACAFAVVGFACGCALVQREDGQLIPFALGVMVYAYSGLLGVFGCALLTRRGTARSAAVALGAGVVVTWVLTETPVTIDGTTAPLAFPWRMLIATLITFTICALPPGRRRAARSAAR